MKAEKLENHFSCPVCYELPRGKIFQCQNGHSVCDRCSKSLENCPECRVDMTLKVRNGALEHIIEGLLTNKRNGPQKLTFLDAKSSPRSMEKLGKSSITFNVECRWCKEKPLKDCRYVCLGCGSNCCTQCHAWAIPERGLRGRGGSPCISSEKHIFALIESAPQNETFLKLQKNQNGKPLLGQVKISNKMKISPQCSQCHKSLENGFMCLQCQGPVLLCETCRTTNFHSISDHTTDHVFAVVNDKNKMIRVRNYVTSLKSDNLVSTSLHSVMVALFCLLVISMLHHLVSIEILILPFQYVLELLIMITSYVVSLLWTAISGVLSLPIVMVQMIVGNVKTALVAAAQSVLTFMYYVSLNVTIGVVSIFLSIAFYRYTNQQESNAANS